MTRLMRSIYALTACLTLASGTIVATSATAVPPPESTGVAAQIATIQANYARTSHVAEDAMRSVQGAGSAVIGIGFDGTVTAKIVSGKVSKTARPAATTAYPSIGPYWQVIRWADATAPLTSDSRVHFGHPFVIFYDTDNISSIHPIAAEVRRWNTYDFVTVWTGDAVSGQYRDYQLSDYWKAQTSSGAEKDNCSHTYMHWDANYTVNRMIGYWDHEAFNFNCFDIAEINYYCTAIQIGMMQGLYLHLNDGSPSVMSQPPGVGDYTSYGPEYLWPQTYDWRTKDWYN